MVWVAAICVAVILASRQQTYIDGVGIVEPRVVAVAPLVDGTVHSIGVDLFDTVTVGQTLAVMDDTLVTAELMTAQAELTRLGTAIRQENHRLELELAARSMDEVNDLRRFVLNEEAASLDYMDRVVQQKSDEVTLTRLALLMGRQKGLVQENILDEDAYDDVRLRHDALETRIRENVAVIEASRQRLNEATARRESRSATQISQTDVATLLSPLQEAVAVQQATINEITRRSEQLVLRAPLAGQVANIIHRPGETVLSGQALLTISDPDAARVIAYVDEGAAHDVEIGADVELRSRGAVNQIAMARIVKTAPQIQEMPQRLWRNPISAQWGRSFLVGEISAAASEAFLPGEIVDVRFALVPR
jgi:multidrug resistance efflux pump